MEDEKLVELAYEAQKMAYAPYSNFIVGAALLGRSGRVYKGCNIENAAYTPTNCAERTAFFKAVSEGELEFEAIAIVGNVRGKMAGSGDFCAPCGVCRQVMMEFCNPREFKIILASKADDIKTFTLEQLLPLGFGAKDLGY